MSDDDGDDSGLAGLLGDGDSDGESDASDAPADTGREGRHTVEVELETDHVGVYDLQRHRNGDVTALVLSSFGDGYQAIALDVDSGGQILDTARVGEADTDQRAASMCEYWLDQHPNGILGADGGDGGGLLDVLTPTFGGDT